MDFLALPLDRFIGILKSIRLARIITYSIEISVFNARRVDPDQTPRFAPSNLGLRCLPMSFLWDARHINNNIYLNCCYQRDSYNNVV